MKNYLGAPFRPGPHAAAQSAYRKICHWAHCIPSTGACRIHPADALRRFNNTHYRTRCALHGLESLEEHHRNAQSAFIVDLLNFRIVSRILLSKINF